jgi:hypothetical protein
VPVNECGSVGGPDDFLRLVITPTTRRFVRLAVWTRHARSLAK